MLAKDAFLRKIPNVIPLEDRLRWEVIANSTDTVGFAFEQLSEALGKFDPDEEVPQIDRWRLQASTYCWTIIDHTHACLQIFRRLSLREDSRMLAFMNKYGKTISDMRNLMDHLDVRIPNLAKKNKGSPAYGIVQFVAPGGPGQIRKFIGFGLGVFHDEQALEINGKLDDLLGNEKVANIIFTVFDDRVNFTSMIKDLSDAINWFDDSLRSQITPQIEKHCQEFGLNFKEVLDSGSSGTLIMNMSISMVDVIPEP